MSNIVNITFNNPVYLWLFLSIIIGIATHFINLGWSRKKGVTFANYEVIEKVTRKKIIPRNNFQFSIRVFALSLLIFALADAVIWYDGYGINSNVVMAIDSSGSMLADDYFPTRLDVAKSTAMEVISRLESSTKIGIITFAGTPFLKQGLTSDKIDIRDNINNIKVLEAGGTAIGEAILLGSNILNIEDNIKGRTIVLITDGQNNVGASINDAITYANDQGVIVNTIGMGTEAGGKFAAGSALSVLDREGLIKIADETGGRFFHAKTEDDLKVSLSDIFNSEKLKISINARTHLLLIAFLLLIVDWLFANTKYRIMP